MRKSLLAAFATVAGCMAGGSNPMPSAQTFAASVTTPSRPSEPGELRNLPHLRYVTPGSGGDGGVAGAGGTSSAGWRPLQNQPSFYAATSLLLTDGSVMAQDAGTSNWWKLTPDATGSYGAGTWTQLASMPDGYAPLYFASAVLPDGRVIVEGGEYQGFNPAWTTQGAIYDPQTDQWTSIAPPPGWESIGDAQSVVLADGRFMLANCCSTQSAILDPKTLTWTAYGQGKADVFDEEGWTLLPSGKLLTVDANNEVAPQLSELFSPTTATWTPAGDTLVQLADLDSDGGGSHELGPQILRYDGSVFVVGATGHSAVYHPAASRWTAGPDLPVVAGEGQLDMADGPAALMPNGHVLIVASAGVYNTPAHVLTFDGKALKEIGAPPNAVNDSSYSANLLLLPSGEVMFTDFSNDVELYSPSGKPSDSWAPQVENGCQLGSLAPGGTYRLTGRRLNGLSQAVAYGDDVQAATNYPIVRIKNLASGNVVYARTHGHGSMGVANVVSSTSFDVPATIEAGPSELFVVANGIASAPVSVKIAAHPIQ